MSVSPAQRRVLERIAAGGVGWAAVRTVTTLRCLRRDGLVDDDHGRLVLTAAGRAELGDLPPPPIDLDALVAALAVSPPPGTHHHDDHQNQQSQRGQHSQRDEQGGR